MNITHSEWRNQNSGISYPFSSSSDNFLSDFIVDVKFFLDQYTIIDVYLQKIERDTSKENYTLYFAQCSNDAIILSGQVPIYTTKSYLTIKQASYEERFVVFTPGPAWASEETQEKVFPIQFATSESSQVEQAAISGQPSMLKRIAIYGDKDHNTEDSPWRKESVLKIYGGYNVDIEQDANGMMRISARNGGGLGSSVPTSDHILKTINGVPPNKSGAISLNMIDCLHALPGRLQTTDGTKSINITEHAITLKNDCIPCCGCDSYSRLSQEINNRHIRYKELQKILTDKINSVIDKYENAVRTINQNITSAARFSNTRVLDNRIIIAFQNLCAYPVCPVYAINILCGSYTFSLTLPSGYSKYEALNGLDLDDSANRSTLVTILGSTYSTIEWPKYLSSGYSVDSNSRNPTYQSGYPHRGIVDSSVKSGGYIDFIFTCNTSGVDIRNQTITITAYSNVLQGKDPIILGCTMDTYEYTREAGASSGDQAPQKC